MMKYALETASSYLPHSEECSTMQTTKIDEEGDKEKNKKKKKE